MDHFVKKTKKIRIIPLYKQKNVLIISQKSNTNELQILKIFFIYKYKTSWKGGDISTPKQKKGNALLR